jgi:hypothetical protein
MPNLSPCKAQSRVFHSNPISKYFMPEWGEREGRRENRHKGKEDSEVCHPLYVEKYI